MVLDAWTWAAKGWVPKPPLRGHEEKVTQGRGDPRCGRWGLALARRVKVIEWVDAVPAKASKEVQIIELRKVFAVITQFTHSLSSISLHNPL